MKMKTRLFFPLTWRPKKMPLQGAVIVMETISRLHLRVNQYRAYNFKSPCRLTCISARKKLYQN